MAKIQRKTAVIFGGNLTAVALGLENFGSFANGGAVYSTDPATIQATGAWLAGWTNALSGDLPVLEDMNAKGFVDSYQLAYLLQQGIPEWDASTTYYTNGFCSSAGVIYKSVQDNNTNHAVSDASWWTMLLLNPFVMTTIPYTGPLNNLDPVDALGNLFSVTQATGVIFEMSVPLTLTGLSSVGRQNGDEVNINSIGTGSLTLKNDDAGSLAQNRFLTNAGTDFALPAGKCAVLRYVDFSALFVGGGGRWMVVQLV